jgi:hypothetical protein
VAARLCAELNPEEQSNQWIKADMPNAAPPSVQTLRASVRGRVGRRRRHPELLRQFFDHAGYP